MATFVFRCPKTALRVQGWIADDPDQRASEGYEAVTCTVCTSVHLVDPKTGKVVGEDEDD